MSPRIFKVLFISFIMLFSAFFINFDSVKAAGCATNLKDPDTGDNIFTSGDQCYNNAAQMDEGYALCYYYADLPVRKGTLDIGSRPGVGMVRDVQFYRRIDISIQVTHNGTSGEKKYYASSLSTKCSDEYAKDNYQDPGETYDGGSWCHVNFATMTPNDSEEQKTFSGFYNNGTWSCPSSVKIYYGKNYNGEVGLTNMYFNIGQNTSTNEITAYLWKDLSDNSKTVNYDTGENVSAGVDFNNVDLQAINNWVNDIKNNGNDLYSYDNSDMCNIIDGSVRDFLSLLLWILCIAGIVLLIVMSIVEFIKLITGSDDEGFRKAFKHLLIRALCVVILLLLPMLITWLIDVVNKANYDLNDDGSIKIGADGNPICNIDK